MASIHRVFTGFLRLLLLNRYVGLKRMLTHWPTQRFNPYACQPDRYVSFKLFWKRLMHIDILDTRKTSPRPALLHITVFLVKLAGLVTGEKRNANCSLESLRTSPRRPPGQHTAIRSSSLVPGTDFLKMNLGKLFNQNIEIVMDFFRKLMISAEISTRESKTRHNNGEQACLKRKFDAFQVANIIMWSQVRNEWHACQPDRWR